MAEEAGGQQRYYRLVHLQAVTILLHTALSIAPHRRDLLHRTRAHPNRALAIFCVLRPTCLTVLDFHLHSVLGIVAYTPFIHIICCAVSAVCAMRAVRVRAPGRFCCAH